MLSLIWMQGYDSVCSHVYDMFRKFQMSIRNCLLTIPALPGFMLEMVFPVFLLVLLLLFDFALWEISRWVNFLKFMNNKDRHLHLKKNPKIQTKLLNSTTVRLLSIFNSLSLVFCLLLVLCCLMIYIGCVKWFELLVFFRE